MDSTGNIDDKTSPTYTDSTERYSWYVTCIAGFMCAPISFLSTFLSRFLRPWFLDLRKIVETRLSGKCWTLLLIDDVLYKVEKIVCFKSTVRIQGGEFDCRLKRKLRAIGIWAQVCDVTFSLCCHRRMSSWLSWIEVLLLYVVLL